MTDPENTKPVGVTYGKLVLVQFMWGGTFVASEIALRDLPPLTTAAVRFVLTTLAYLLLMRPRLHTLVKLGGNSVRYLALMGLFGVFAYTVLLNYGLILASAANAALLIPTTQPVFTMFLASIVLRRRPSAHLVAALCIGLIGATMVISGQNALGSAPEALLGDLLLLAASLSFSCYMVAGKLAAAEFDSTTMTTVSTIVGTLLLLPTPFLLETQHWHRGIFTWQTAGAIFYLVVFATVIPYIWWNESVRRLGPVTTGLFTLLLPPIALLLAAVLLGQDVSSTQLLGGAFALTAVAMAMGLHTTILARVRVGQSQTNECRDQRGSRAP